MKMEKYALGDKVINATPTAYEAIYKAQGFVPFSAPVKPKKTVEPDEGAEDNGKDGSSAGNNRKSPATRKRTKSES